MINSDVVLFPENLVDIMLESKESWQNVHKMIRSILKKKRLRLARERKEWESIQQTNDLRPCREHSAQEVEELYFKLIAWC